MQAICHRPQQWADRTLRDLASVLLLEALTRVMVFMCEKDFLTGAKRYVAPRHSHDGSCFRFSMVTAFASHRIGHRSRKH